MGTKTPTYLEKLKAERDELAAELGRVKAERDAYRSCLIQSGVIFADTPPMDQFVADVIGGALKIEHNEFQSIKSRLPVNADGDVVLWGDEQFYIDSTDGSVVNSFAVEEIVREEKSFGFLSMEDVIHLPEDCHSTAESCRAAHEKGE